MAELLAGAQVLGRYTLEGVIGRGGMGQVWRARHDLLEMPVAVKTLLAEEEGMRQRLEQEARLMARVQHPNVCRIMDFGMHEGQHCLVLELLAGEDLEARLKRVKSVSWREALPIVLGLLDGLEAVHGVGMLHRDLKPANVWLLDRPRDTPKLMDFGIARGASPDATRLTATGMLVGTPAYMAPEVLWGEDASWASDLYAVGLILYEMVTGELPFKSETMAQVMRRLKEAAERPCAPAHQPPLPPNLEAMLMALLSARPKHRPDLATLKMWLRRAMSDVAVEIALPEPVAEEVSALAATGQLAFDETWSGVPAQATPGYGVLGAMLPASRLADREERAWLAELVQADGRGLTLGAQLWFVLFRGEDEDSVEWRMMEVEQRLRDRYGELVQVRAELSSEPVKLSPAMLSGASALPEVIQRMMVGLQGG
jgi:hypothetical protein